MVRGRLTAAAMLAMLVLPLGGCGEIVEAQDSAAPPATPVERFAPVPDAASRGWSGLAFTLDANGLRVESDDPLVLPVAVPFGSPRAEVLRTLEPVLGRPASPEQAAAGQPAVFGPVMNASFGQTEAPMCVTALPPHAHLDASGDGFAPSRPDQLQVLFKAAGGEVWPHPWLRNVRPPGPDDSAHIGKGSAIRRDVAAQDAAVHIE